MPGNPHIPQELWKQYVMAAAGVADPGNPQRHQEIETNMALAAWTSGIFGTDLALTARIFGPDMALTALLATLDFERQVPAAAGKKKVQPEWSQIWGTNGI